MWKKRSDEEIKELLFSALSKNVDYSNENILGLPASLLDEKVFHRNASFLKDAPYITTLLRNPNHIGVHTSGSSESFFAGTQEIERELIEICAEDIFRCTPNGYDGYVASGGTEANLQAVWLFREYFKNENRAKASEIGLLCSQDAHYCVDKAANIFDLDLYKVSVEDKNRKADQIAIDKTIEKAKSECKSNFIVVLNMITTMFGSVDEIDIWVECLKRAKVEYKIHVDAAFGGFYYPFSNPNFQMHFANEEVSSITLDAHKMAQAPYGTGIFLVRKGYLQYAQTSTAGYVEGYDNTLIGSRSGANAVAVWMILNTHGPNGWSEKIFILQKRTDFLCAKLDEKGIGYYRHTFANIVTIPEEYIGKDLAQKYGLIPDNHHAPKWYKIVVMDHVTVEKLELFLSEL